MAKRIEVFEGITAGVRVGQDFLSIEEDGYVGRLNPGVAVIDVLIEPGHEAIHGIDVDGKKNMGSRRNLVSPDQGQRYQTKIEIKTGLDGVFHTQYPANNIRLLRLDPDAMVIQELTLVSQEGNFFFTQHVTEASRCYLDGENVVCPGSRFNDRPQTLGFFARLLGEGIHDLAPVTEYEEPSGIDVGTMADGTGVVFFYTISMGFGGILTKKGPARIHWTNVAGTGRLAYLKEGSRVRYGQLRPIKSRGGQRKASSLRALSTVYHAADLRETTFEKEAVGVTPI